MVTSHQQFYGRESLDINPSPNLGTALTKSGLGLPQDIGFSLMGGGVRSLDEEELPESKGTVLPIGHGDCRFQTSPCMS